MLYYVTCSTVVERNKLRQVGIALIRQSNKEYVTIVDAAKELEVSPKTVREYIAKGIIPPPPEFSYGVRTMFYFPPDYMKRAKAGIEKHKRDLLQKRKRPAS